MGTNLKSLQIGFLFFFCAWVALSQGTGTPGLCVKISTCTLRSTARVSMEDSHILDEMAQAATKNQGGNKAIKGIKGLKVKDVRPPNMTVTFVVKKGLCMMLVTQITIAGKSFIGGSMEITVRSNMTTETKLTVKNGFLVFEVVKCNVVLLSCKTNLPSSMLPKIVNKFLNSTLGKVLPGMMCPAADKVVAEMKKKMESLLVPQMIGDVGKVKYSLSGAPDITTHHAGVCFQAQITEQPSGNEVEIATDPAPSGEMPELDSKNSELTMPASIMNAALKPYKAQMDMEASSDTEEAGPMINRDAMKEKAPSMEIPESYGALKFKMRCTDTPTWLLEEGVAFLTASLTIELVGSAQEDSIFLVTLDLKIAATFKVVDGQLHTFLGESSVENLQGTSTVLDGFDPESLRGYLLDLLKVTFIPVLTKIVAVLLPLPSLMGSGYGESIIEIYPNMLRVVVQSECDIPLHDG